MITDHGMISDADGRVPWRIVAMSANKSAGEVYITSDLVMNESDPIHWRSYRHDETAAHIYTRRIHGQAFMVAQVPIPVGANLAISAEDSGDPVTVGDQVTYDLTVRNFGPETAIGAVVTSTLPPGTISSRHHPPVAKQVAA